MKLPKLPDFAAMSRRERALAAGSALIVAGVLLDRLVLSPWLGHTGTVHREISRLEEDLRSYDGLLARKPQILAEAELYRDYLDARAQEGDMASLLREIESLGRESGITLGEVKPSEGAANEVYQDYTIEVQYQGSLQQWIRFIYLVQTSKALFTIQRNTMAKTDDEAGTLQGALRLSGRVIRKQDQPAPEGPDEA